MFKIIACILSAVLATVYADRLPLGKHISDRADFALANFLLKHKSPASPQDSLQCFNIYVPILQQASTQWADQYEDCLDVAHTDRNVALELASSARSNISAEAANVCGYIQTCDAMNDSLSAVDCFALLYDNSASNMYLLSNDASDVAAEIREKMYIINANSSKCCEAAERNYVETTARVYDALDYCLSNGPPATAAPPTTPTAEPTTTPIVEPTNTTSSSRNVKLVAAPRRVQTVGLLSKASKDETKNSPSKSNIISVFNNWLQQNGKDVVENP